MNFNSISFNFSPFYFLKVAAPVRWTHITYYGPPEVPPDAVDENGDGEPEDNNPGLIFSVVMLTLQAGFLILLVSSQRVIEQPFWFMHANWLDGILTAISVWFASISLMVLRDAWRRRAWVRTRINAMLALLLIDCLIWPLICLVPLVAAAAAWAGSVV